MITKFKIPIFCILAILLIIVMIKTSDDPMPSFFKGTKIECFFSQLETGNSILFNISTGLLISMFFFIIIVWRPERKRKIIIKGYLKEQFANFKRNVIVIFFNALGESYNINKIEKLCTLNEFKKYFKEAVGGGQNKWDKAITAIEDDTDRKLLYKLFDELDKIMIEINFALNNIKMNDKNIYNFFKNTSNIAFDMRNSGFEYDEMKIFYGYIWQIFTGWSFIEGYREEDIFDVMLEKL